MISELCCQHNGYKKAPAERQVLSGAGLRRFFAPPFGARFVLNLDAEDLGSLINHAFKAFAVGGFILFEHVCCFAEGFDLCFDICPGLCVNTFLRTGGIY